MNNGVAPLVAGALLLSPALAFAQQHYPYSCTWTSQMTPDQTMTTSPVSPVWSHQQQQAQYHHHQYQSPVTPVAPVYHHDSSSSHGYYSDTSLQSPASRSWTQSPEFNKLSWSASLTDQRYFQNIKQESPEVPDSTTTDMNDSSGDEDDVLDAIAEWQQI